MNTEYKKIKKIVENKLIYKTDPRSFEELSEILFGEGNCFNESEVRKRMYGMKRIIEIIDADASNVATTILSLSDFHVPYQLPISKLEEFFGDVDILQINGDILDCQSISKFSKQFRVSPIEEMIQGRRYLINLIEHIKPKKVVVNYGNHELRLGDYLSRKLENELQELMPVTALDYIFTDGFTHYDRELGTKSRYTPLCELFPDIQIEYTGKWYSTIGDAIFVHPRAFSSAPMKTAEKALGYFRNEGFIFKNLIMSHTHRIGQYKIGNTNIYEQGAFCDTTKMMYSDGLLVNSQKQGFIVLYQDKDGNTIESKTRLISLN